MNAYTYMRVSTERQETLRQEKEIENYAVGHGIHVVRTFGEADAKSGKSKDQRAGAERQLRYYGWLIEGQYHNLERPAMAEMLRCLAKDEHIDCVIFYALDRLSRDTIELLLLEVILQKYNVVLHLISQGGEIRTDNAMGKMMYRMMAMQAELEIDVTSDRIKSSLQVKRALHGDAFNKRPPAGWLKVDGIYAHDPVRWEMITQANRLREQGKTFREIAGIMGTDAMSARRFCLSFHFEPPVFENMPAHYYAKIAEQKSILDQGGSPYDQS